MSVINQKPSSPTICCGNEGAIIMWIEGHRCHTWYGTKHYNLAGIPHALNVRMEGLPARTECNVRAGNPHLYSVRMEGLEPPCLAALDPKSSASTNFATSANNKIPVMQLETKRCQPTRKRDANLAKLKLIKKAAKDF